VSRLDAVALALGVLVIGAAAYFASPLAAQSDPNVRWEGRVAAGFVKILPFGVLWTAQAVATLFATLSAGGIWPGWLWIWLLAASAIGTSPPVAALTRRLVRTNGTDPRRVEAAVQRASNLAWAETTAEPGWELRRTPPLPREWPPLPYGTPVWFCYAERAVGPDSTEVAGPLARIMLGADVTAAPVVARLSDALAPVGWQGTRPATRAGRGRPTQADLIDAIWHGDPKGVLAGELELWQVHNAVIAAQPMITQHLPRAVES
jgi:hypothetical protein